MSSVMRPRVIQFSMAWTLYSASHHRAATSEVCTIDVLDVGGTPPPCHQRPRGCPAVFIRENNRVLQYGLYAIPQAFAIGDQRNVGEPSHRVFAGVKIRHVRIGREITVA